MSAVKKGSRRSSSGAAGSPAAARGTPRKAPPGQPEWVRCDASGLWRHAASEEEHRRWLEGGGPEAGDDGLPEGHVVVDGAAGPTARGPLPALDLTLVPAAARPACGRAVFMGEPLMRLLGLGFGDLVTVESGGAARRVLRALPLDRPETAGRMLVSPDSTRGAARGTAVVAPLPGPVGRALEVSVRGDFPPALAAETLAALFKSALDGAVLTAGEELSLPVYGSDVSVTVATVRTAAAGGGDAVSELASQVASVELCDRPARGVLDWSSKIVVSNTRQNSASAGDLRQSSGDFSLVGGLDEEMERLCRCLRATLFPGSGDDARRRRRGGGGVLLWGPPGTGKTLAGESVASHLGAALVSLSAADVASGSAGEAEGRLSGAFREAEERQPCVLFLDEVDAFCPSARGEGSGRVRLSSALARLMDDSGKRGARVAVVAATSRPASLDPRLRTGGRLGAEVELGVPNSRQRGDILAKILRGSDLDEDERIDPEDVCAVAAACHGFVGSDLQALVGEALMEAGEGRLTVEHLRAAAGRVKPSAMKEALVEVPSVRWEDIGGLEELKLALRQAVSWPLERPEAFRKMGIQPPRGVLMYGPPGCSKTMIAKALANESGLNFLSVKGPKLFSKWVGESEAAVRELFRKARRVAPAIIFFDEIDALGSERGGGGSGSGGGVVGNRVLAQILTEMDGIEQLNGVTVVAATNRPDLIDGALMRPGRLDRQFYVPLPDPPTRERVLRIHTRNKPLAAGVSLAELVDRTGGYSGAEVAAVCNEAAYKALEEAVEADDGDRREIEMRHFESALSAVTPRINDDLLKIYDAFNSKAK